mmetsp:Transcript_11370/g.17066  ORF Transcript_11370/g.17066 Transcript_11370/m.17066 type:complete len:847 (-) Transcript_11370:181-2721(-)|eukprot:CAMPEP_0196810380 /NCGR_PEP_ID=MMETSP1362-20130617/10196_1 /TAXON_ID=163516 /ORGANISM="Leptocylindrus danicus, Strain CCMP1856" /LENGTH=846 /DNA_ID=CAMNT_0042185347 /DNA_START=670 /DNA_END=3210 /DNA_ORIENTATION=+
MRTTTVLLLSSLLNTLVYGSELANFSSRRTESYTLVCPPEDTEYNTDEDYAGAAHSLSKFSYGGLGTTLVEKLRDESTEFYQDVVDYLIMFQCDLGEASQRCVPENSSDAAKDWEGNCVVSSDYTCPVGSCERISNCYWKPARAGQPREKRFGDKEYHQAEDALFNWQDRESYIGSILQFAVPGIAAGFSFLFLWSIYFLGRLCCCCMWNSCDQCNYCSPVPRREGYNICWEIRFPVSLYFACLVGIAFTGSLAYIGNEDISDACTNTFHYARALVEDSQLFLSRARIPLVNIDDIAEDAAVDAEKIFDDTDYVHETADEIGDAFINFGVVHQQGILLSDSQQEYDSAVIKFQDEIDPIVIDIQSMLDTLENDLYINVEEIKSALSSAIDQIDSYQNETRTWRDDIDDAELIENANRTIRQGAVLSLFAFSLLLVTLGLIGVIYSKNSNDSFMLYFLNVAWMFCALLGTLAFLLGAVFLCLNVFWHDACEMSDIATADFEPFLGESAAAGANACFDGTNLAVAYNVTDQIDFQEKLDKGLAEIEDVNITAEFEKVTAPLNDLQVMIEDITTSALDVLNDATSMNHQFCPFNDTYTKSSILEPWNENTGKISTTWILNSTGSYGDYARIGAENSTEYMKRIYSVAGICIGPSCCLGNDCATIAIEDSCNGGVNCNYPCGNVGEKIAYGHVDYLEGDLIEKKMTADLGVKCPDGYSCPTGEFQSMGHSLTLYDLITTYGINVTATKDDLVNLTETKVGEAMDEIEDFLCNMDVSFVGKRYNQVEKEFCETMFGGFSQISGALWAIALLLEISAVLASVLSVRLRGVSEDEADDYYGGVKSLRRADLYG